MAGVLALGVEVARMASSRERTWRQASSPVLVFREAIEEDWRREGGAEVGVSVRGWVGHESCFRGFAREERGVRQPAGVDG